MECNFHAVGLFHDFVIQKHLIFFTKLLIGCSKLIA